MLKRTLVATVSCILAEPFLATRESRFFFVHGDADALGDFEDRGLRNALLDLRRATREYAVFARHWSEIAGPAMQERASEVCRAATREQRSWEEKARVIYDRLRVDGAVARDSSSSDPHDIALEEDRAAKTRARHQQYLSDMTNAVRKYTCDQVEAARAAAESDVAALRTDDTLRLDRARDRRARARRGGSSVESNPDTQREEEEAPTCWQRLRSCFGRHRSAVGAQ